MASGRIPCGEFHGMEVSVPIVVARGRADGPTLFVQAMQHGMEVNGFEAARRVLTKIDLQRLKGVLVCVPAANPLATLTRRQAFPTDSGWTERCRHNMNRLWPGRADGTLTERIAAAIFEEVVRHCDAVLDLHCTEITYPVHTLALRGHERSAQLAQAFGAPVIYLSEEGHRGLLYEVAPRELEIPTALAELPPLRLITEPSASVGERGILNVMRLLGMVEGGLDLPPRRAVVTPECKSAEVRAEADGILVPRRRPGDFVEEGDVVAEIWGVFDWGLLQEVRAPISGVVTCLGQPIGYITEHDTHFVAEGEVACVVREVHRVLGPDEPFATT